MIWDIFCDVVDNYGDIGVTWRLSRQLKNEFQIRIRLWVNDLNSFQKIVPTLDPSQPWQQQQEIEICAWTETNYQKWQPGDVLIEAFACQLPDLIRNKLERSDTAALWINLEYLSAEPWIDGCHALPSLQTNGLQKYFFFPGFTEQSGGLFCESDLLDKREQWQTNPQHRELFCQQRSLIAPRPNECFISLFSYENQVLPSWLAALSRHSQPVRLLIPAGRTLNAIRDCLDPHQPDIGQSIHMGQLHIDILPMTNQEEYDRLLWSCDFNIVRGEDSFLRAQWAGRPFLWHIYPQEENAHLDKLNAFLERYTQSMPPELNHAVRQFFLSFNQENAASLLEYWSQLQNLWSSWQRVSADWPKTALSGGNLANRLVHFVKKKIECCA